MAKPEKIDLYKLHKSEYVAPRKPVLLHVKPARYLTMAGEGKPGGDLFQAQMGALFSVAFTIKMASKFAGRDYRVCGPEGLWWAPGQAPITDLALESYCWKLLIRVPDFITQRDLKAAVAALKAKGKPVPAEQVKLETIREGRCVQMLHVGPYATEPETIAQMQALAEQQGLSLKGPHHEIYLSDPRRVAPERLRTILRYPVKS